MKGWQVVYVITLVGLCACWGNASAVVSFDGNIAASSGYALDAKNSSCKIEYQDVLHLGVQCNLGLQFTSNGKKIPLVTFSGGLSLMQNTGEYNLLPTLSFGVQIPFVSKTTFKLPNDFPTPINIDIFNTIQEGQTTKLCLSTVKDISYIYGKAAQSFVELSGSDICISATFSAAGRSSAAFKMTLDFDLLNRDLVSTKGIFDTGISTLKLQGSVPVKKSFDLGKAIHEFLSTGSGVLKGRQLASADFISSDGTFSLGTVETKGISNDGSVAAGIVIALIILILLCMGGCCAGLGVYIWKKHVGANKV